MIRHYRSRAPLAIGLTGAIGFLLLGIAMVIPTRTSDVAEHVIGGFAIVFALFVLGLAFTNGVWLTPDGIVSRETFRRTTIPWDTVGSFTVERSPQNQVWRTVRVNLRPEGSRYLSSVSGRRRRIERVMAEFEEYRSRVGQIASGNGITRPQVTRPAGLMQPRPSPVQQRSQGQLVRHYRSPLVFVVGMSAGVVFLICGTALLVPTFTSAVSQHVFGGFIVGGGFWLFGATWTNGVWLTPEGITRRVAFRRRTIPWETVGSFTVGRLPQSPSWRTIMVSLGPQGSAYLSPIAGTERYIQRVIAEFEEYRTQIG